MVFFVAKETFLDKCFGAFKTETCFLNQLKKRFFITCISFEESLYPMFDPDSIRRVFILLLFLKKTYYMFGKR